LRWKLKEDGTHDKYKYERVAKEKEDSDEESEVEEVETFICNEKIY
jgi:hypothetical protein